LFLLFIFFFFSFFYIELILLLSSTPPPPKYQTRDLQKLAKLFLVPLLVVPGLRQYLLRLLGP
jgi:hypothetical protein